MPKTKTNDHSSSGALLTNVFERLQELRLIKTKKAFAARVGNYEGPVSEMMKGIRPITVGVLMHLYNEFGINANFLISGQGPMFAKRNGELILDDVDVIKSDYKKIEDLEKELTHLKDKLESKNKIIQLLENQKG